MWHKHIMPHRQFYVAIVIVSVVGLVVAAQEEQGIQALQVPQELQATQERRVREDLQALLVPWELRPTRALQVLQGLMDLQEQLDP